MNWKTIGFNRLKKYFTKALKGDLSANSFLFYGQEMIGKRTFAMELAGISGDYQKQINQDVMLVDSSSSESGQSISIDEVRKIKQFLSLRPMGGEHKFVIIDDAHKMQEPAQNALLKIVEEPPAYAIIMLVSHRPDSLLPTINSRCQKMYFPTPGKEEIKKVIASCAGELNNEQIDFLADFSSGRTGLILKIFDNDSFKEIKPAAEQFYKLEKMPIAERLQFSAKMADAKQSDKLDKLTLYWLLYLRPKAKADPRIAKVVKNLLDLKYALGQPQYNHRLALDNFLIGL
ncbi:MAG: AAA family ATPase [bacterium]|nr:AAA family ATPase [bacterium]